MTTSWEQYFVYIFAAVFFSLFPLGLWILSKFTHRDQQELQSRAVEPDHSSRSWDKVQFNSGFYVGIGVLSLGVLALVLVVPIITGISQLSDGRIGLALILLLTTLVALALFYALKRGDLDWDR